MAGFVWDARLVSAFPFATTDLHGLGSPLLSRLDDLYNQRPFSAPESEVARIHNIMR